MIFIGWISRGRINFDLQHSHRNFYFATIGANFYISFLFDYEWRKRVLNDEKLCYGNIFTDELFVRSSTRERVIDRANERIKRYCGGCIYHGYCSGQFVGDATPEQEAFLMNEGCEVKHSLDRFITRMEFYGIDRLVDIQNKVPPTKNSALKIGF